MVMILKEEDRQYIKKRYHEVKIEENKIVWDFNFTAEYKWYKISDHYSLTIELKSRPWSILPMVRDNTDRVVNVSKKYDKQLEDIHINNDKTFCLVIDKEEKKYFEKWEFNFPEFFEIILEPYLYGMSFFEKKWIFPWGERAHWFLWYLELYDEWQISLEELITNDEKKVIHKYKNIKGHHECPCWSWKKIRDCHKQILGAFYKLRKENG